jgi:hypothetical protein
MRRCNIPYKLERLPVIQDWLDERISEFDRIDARTRNAVCKEKLYEIRRVTMLYRYPIKVGSYVCYL